MSSLCLACALKRLRQLSSGDRTHSEATVEQSLPSLGRSLRETKLEMLAAKWALMSSRVLSFCIRLIILSFSQVKMPLQCSCITYRESKQLQTCKGVSPDLLGSTKCPKISMFSSSPSFYTILEPSPDPVPPPRLLMTLMAIAQSIVSSSRLTFSRVNSQMALFSEVYLSKVRGDSSI